MIAVTCFGGDAGVGGGWRRQTIDDYYVDELSITHGNSRQHIWTF